jgi:hypothetical protein
VKPDPESYPASKNNSSDKSTILLLSRPNCYNNTPAVQENQTTAGNLVTDHQRIESPTDPVGGNPDRINPHPDVQVKFQGFKTTANPR